MKITTRFDVVRLEDGDLSINDIVKSLAKLPISELVKFLKAPHFYSRRDYATILKNVMKEEVSKFKLVSSVAEKGLAHDFYSRLDFFEDSPVTVLENLFLKMVKNQPELVDMLLEDLWLFALQVVEGKNKELVALIKRGQSSTTSPIVLRDLFPTIGSLFEDEVGDIDGVLISGFTKKSIHSATLKELRQIGERFAIPLPTTITKQDIFDGIIALLPRVAKAKDIPAITEDLQDMTIAELKAFVEKHNLEVATELKKVDIGEILVAEFDKLGHPEVYDDLEFVLPERVDDKGVVEDDSKVDHLTEKIKKLEKELASRPVEQAVVTKEVIKEVVDHTAVEESAARIVELEEELRALREELRIKPREVVKEVQGPTVVRTVVSKKELLRQKEKYEAIIAEQEKERALFLTQSDEQAEVLAKYNEIKEQLAKKEVELEEEVNKRQTAPIRREEEVVSRYEEPGALYNINAKVDRLVDKIHELQLELVRREARRYDYDEEPKSRQQDSSVNDTEVNLYFDSNLAKQMLARQKGASGKRVLEKKPRKKMRKGVKIFLWTLFILILLTVGVFMLGWAAVQYWGAPFAGPPWLADTFNAAISWLHSIVKLVFDTVASWFN